MRGQDPLDLGLQTGWTQSAGGAHRPSRLEPAGSVPITFSGPVSQAVKVAAPGSSPEAQAEVDAFNDALQSGSLFALREAVIDTLGRDAWREVFPGLSGSYGQLQLPPPFAEISDDTRECFQDRYGIDIDDWPATDCVQPLEQELDCSLPVWTPQVGDVPIEILDEDFLRKIGWISGEEVCGQSGDVTSIDAMTPGEVLFITAAIALLFQHLDAIRWTCCLAGSWSNGGRVGNTIVTANQLGGNLDDRVMDLLTGGGWSVYLIGEFPPNFDDECNESGNPTGSATRLFPRTPDGNVGVVIPIRHGQWVDAVETFLSGEDGPRMCGIVNLASVILHELIHLAEPDTNPDCTSSEDGLCCWEEQRMVQTAFQWLMAQRYSCLDDQNERNCNVPGYDFASSYNR